MTSAAPSAGAIAMPRADADDPPSHRWGPLPYRLSSALAVAATLASAVGVFHPGIFRDPAVTAGNARGTDVAILAIAIPTLLASMVLTVRGSLRAQIVWLGALSYIVYNAVFFAYGALFNALFRVYAAMLSLSVGLVVAVLMEVDVGWLRAHFARGTPVRATAAYLLATTVLFALVWLKDLIPAIAGNTAPAGLAGTRMVTNPVQLTDFAFAFPLTALAALWLWHGRARGYLLAGAFLVYGVIEASSVAMDQLFGHIGDPSQSLAAVPVFVGLTALGLVPTVVYLRGLQTSPDLRRGRAIWKLAEDRASSAAMSRVHSQDHI